MALTDLTPVTRMESILNGDDIEPVTREEYFWKQAASGGSTPEYDAEVTFVYDNEGHISCSDTFSNQYALGNGVSKVVFIANGVPVAEDICNRINIMDSPDTPVSVAYSTKVLKFSQDSETQIVAKSIAVSLNSDNSVIDASNNIYVNLAT
jgi:hypothetical protein